MDPAAAGSGMGGGDRRTAPRARLVPLALAGLALALPAHGQMSAERGEPQRLPQVDLAMLADPVPRTGLGLRFTGEGPAQRLQAGAPQLNLALRWRPGSVAGYPVEGQLWHRVSTPGADPAHPMAPDEAAYGARVEMQLKKDKPFASLRDLLGMQLDNGARISLRPSKGKVSIYYKVQF